MRSVVAVAPGQATRTVLVPEVLPADADGAGPSAMPLRSPGRPPGSIAAAVVEYAAIPSARGDLVDLYC
jgi:hypothetical protein